MLLFDAHLDLAMNAMEWNRDLTRPIDEIRQCEQNLRDKPDRGQGTVSFAEMKRGGIGLCVATQIARYSKPKNPLPGWRSAAQAWAHTQGQLAWYRVMEEAGELVQINDAAGLEKHLRLWEKWLGAAPTSPRPNPANTELAPQRAPSIGYVLSLEGGDSLIDPRHLERAHAAGLRAIGPAHYGPGTYAQGTGATGGLGVRGRELLEQMQRLGIILDVTHLCDQSFWEAVDHYGGPVWASHSNCRTLVPRDRQLADDQIRCLIARGSVIGIALDAWMLVAGWERGKSTPEAAGLSLERVVDHIDHVCQLAGNALHVGIGSDLDGGFGREQSPADVNTISDLADLPELLKARGYTERDTERIMHVNFVQFLKQAWR